MQTKRMLFSAFVLAGSVLPLSMQALPLPESPQTESVDRAQLRQLIASAEDEVQSKKSLYGFKHEGTNDEYRAHPGLIVQDNQGNAGFANAQNKTGRVFWPRWMFNSSLGRASDDFITEFTAPRDKKGPRHWIQFDLKRKYKDIVLKFTNCNRSKDGSFDPNKHGWPTKVAMVAPKSGERTGVNDVWTDTLWQGKTIATHRSEYVYHEIKWTADSSTYVGECNFPHETQLVRFVVLETENDPTSSLRGWGPNWGLSEMRLFDAKEWNAENPLYSKFSQTEKDALAKSVEAARQALNGDGSGIASAYTNLEAALKHYTAAYKAEFPIDELNQLTGNVERDLVAKRTVGGHEFRGTGTDYKKFKGLVSDGYGNADVGKGYKKPKDLFDCSIWRDAEFYVTEWNPSRLEEYHKGMSKQRHWVQFDLRKELSEMVFKFTCGNTGGGYSGFKEVAFVAPKAGESTDGLSPWTDTLCKAATLPTYETVYGSTDIKPNTTYVGKFEFDHPVRLIRLVVLKDRNGQGPDANNFGPRWGAAEMRFYEAASWEETKGYRLVPQAIKDSLYKALNFAKSTIFGNIENANYKYAYEGLKKSYDAFYKAYAFASGTLINMKTSKAAGDSISFYVNHSISSYQVDWGDGVLENFTTTEGQNFNKISGIVKGENLSVYCARDFSIFNASHCGLKSIDLSHASDMRQLYLSHNSLDSINLDFLVNLTDLDCSANKLTKLELIQSDKKSKIPSMCRLNVSNNSLSGTFDAKGMSSLQYLNISNNMYSMMNLEGTKLATLVCSNNQLVNSLPVKDLKELSNLAANNNKLKTTTFFGDGLNIRKLIMDNNNMLMLNLQTADSLDYLSCSKNRLRLVSLSPKAHPYGVAMSDNFLTLSSLPGPSNKPRYVNFIPQDSMRIGGVPGILHQDGKDFAPVATSWADREKAQVDFVRFCGLCDQTIDVDMKWYRVVEGGTQELTPCRETNDGDFCFEAGKVSFFKPQAKAYAVIHSNVYDIDLVSLPIQIGKEITGIDETSVSAGLKVGVNASGLVLSSTSALPATVVSMNGTVIWNGVVDGIRTVRVPKGVYVVNGVKVVF